MTVGRIPVIEGGIQPTIFDAKADLLTATANDTPARLAVGANDTVLTADSSTATGLKWASATATGTSWSLLNAGGTALTGATTITVSGISGKDKIMVLVSSASSASASSMISIRLNTDTASNYYTYGFNEIRSSTYDAGDMGPYEGAFDRIYFGKMSGVAGSYVSGGATFSGCNASGVKAFSSTGTGRAQGSNGQEAYIMQGYYNSSSTISSISIVSTTGNFDAGTVFVYTSAA
jgi:hypothetical protein